MSAQNVSHNLCKNCTETYPSNSEYEYVFQTYPYHLSDFQKYAIEAILRGHHVLSCAHTGSGKTLAAEFAIQHFVGQHKKIIYTSPIKALSNQKYYEFTQKYPHISFGLLTGDIKTNPGADVLIMTTEILMNRLFIETVKMKKCEEKEINPNSMSSLVTFDMDFQTELACVVFDEIHYINDADRGHVWEQSIMMLPAHVQMVMLSATIDNPTGFAEWVSRARDSSRDHLNPAENIKGGQTEGQKEVWLASTNHRVVPLTHYMYYATTEDPFKKIKDKTVQEIIRKGTNQLIPILSSTNKFHETAYHKVKEISHIFDRERLYMKRKFVLNSLATLLRDPEKSVSQDSDNEKLPAIIFVFSRRQVEECANEMTTNLLEFDSKIPYTMRHECEQIVRKFPNAKEYLELPEFNQLVKLLEKGVAIHHSGMIPVLREIVEIMISRKAVKMLFATESFAIGLDCPIRTAVFTSLQKYTSEGLRFLYAHEYTQMAGRAGRRGIDTLGYVIHLNNLFREQPTIDCYKDILGGKPQKLVSKFHVGYDTVLMLIKNEKCTYSQIAEYVKKTMWAKEMGIKTINATKCFAEKMQQYNSKKNAIGQLRTPPDVCAKYLEIMDKLPYLANKKRKEADREITGIKDEYRFLLHDIEIHKELRVLSREYEQEREYKESIESMMETDIHKVCNLLCQRGWIEFVKSDSVDTEKIFKITPAGFPATNVAEIYPLLVAHLIQQTNWFAEFDAVDFVAFFSCFTQIKLPKDDARNIIPSNISYHLQNVIKMAQTELEDLQQAELREGVYMKNETYLEMIHYDLLEEMGKWVSCQTELECKYFVQGPLTERGISIGDFTKAVLKIATVAREWMAMCEICGQIDMMNRLSQIDGMILKYITTSQSLYV